MIMVVRIPLMLPGVGLAFLEFEPSDDGDPHGVKVTVPPECNGILKLNRSTFSAEMQKHFDEFGRSGVDLPKVPICERGFA